MLGSVIRSKRLALGWTQAELAERCRFHAPGVSGFWQSHVGSWERGAGRPGPDQLVALRDVLAFAPDEWRAVQEQVLPSPDVDQVERCLHEY